MAVLKDVLDQDFSENQSEVAQVPWKFNYVIQRESDGQVDVMTRLYKPGETGALLYGRTIRRTGRDEFVLWVDD
jgi:hypothetical protein